ncbi:biotin transporter BioY [Halomonas sp. HNIBRBA4712]|uniref:biotin transporter BioY n=1 Tax=Halomonas sp. HNIBRBA4712 TaxID=3373087 RepID=UPI00374516E1
MHDASRSLALPTPLNLSRYSLGGKAVAVVLGSLFLTLCSYIQVPMVPVPVTLQTFGVLLIGALYGWRLGAITTLAWLTQAAMGLPVLAGGANGWMAFAGPTGGYLFSHPLVAALAGWLVQRGWNGERPGLAFLGMALASALCLTVGASWLALFVGVEQAVTLGVAPFVLGDLLKCALVAATLKLIASRQRNNA